MTLAQLIYFMEIVKTRNFTEAASNLYISQSNLSYAIHSLEDELGVSLFTRRPNKKIELTMYGEVFYPYVTDGIKLLEDGKNRVASMRSPHHGKVRLGFFHSIVFSAVPALLRYFKDDNPENEIEFQSMVYHGWVDFRQELLNDKCDLVFSAGDLSDGCESVKIADHRIFLLVPHNHPFAQLSSVPIEDLRDMNLIQIDAKSNMDQRIKQMFKEAGLKPKIRYESDWTVQQLAVLNGQGIALSCDVAQDDRFIRKIPLDHELAIMPLYLSWNGRQKLSGAASYVRDYYLQLAQLRGEELIF